MARSENQALHLHHRDQNLDSNGTKQATKSLSSQIKEMYRHCAPCGTQSPELQNRSRNGTPVSRRRVDSVVFVEESEQKEWVAQVENGVLVTFLSLLGGGNHLKRIQFSREVFDKQQAQWWWAENREKVMELYNVQRLSRGSNPVSTSESHSTSKMGSADDSPMTRSLASDSSQPNGTRTECSLPGSSAHQSYDCSGLTPMFSTSTSTDTKTETSPAGSDLGTEWVEQDEPGVYITVRALPGGRRELKRVRFREKFGEMHARIWWEHNRARIHRQFLHLDST